LVVIADGVDLKDAGGLDRRRGRCSDRGKFADPQLTGVLQVTEVARARKTPGVLGILRQHRAVAAHSDDDADMLVGEQEMEDARRKTVVEVATAGLSAA
jgi:hypothetical protein